MRKQEAKTNQKETSEQTTKATVLSRREMHKKNQINAKYRRIQKHINYGEVTLTV